MPNEKPQKTLFPEPSPGSMVLTDTEINEAVGRGLLIAQETFDPTGLEVIGGNGPNTE